MAVYLPNQFKDMLEITLYPLPLRYIGVLGYINSAYSDVDF